MFLSMSDLGQNSQQDWWNWFFTGQQGPPPKKSVKAAAFNLSKTRGFDNYKATANKAWGGMEYEAPADEDINPMAPQGSDSAMSLTGLGADPITETAKTLPPVSDSVKPVSSNKGAKLLVGTALLGGTIALVIGACSSSPRRFNSRRRNG